MSNLIIENKMEELKKTSLKLAIWNLAEEALVLIILLIFFIGSNPALNESNMKAFTVWNCVMYAALLPIVYCLWFKFFRNMKDAYPDDINISYATRIGIIAIILYSIAAALGLIATVFDAFIITPDNFGCDFNTHGIIPKNNVGMRCNDLILGAGFLMSLMFYFLIKSTKPNSYMRVLTVILALKVPIQIAVFLIPASKFLVSLMYLYFIVEFLFLIQIYKGYEFGQPKIEADQEE